MMSQAKECPNCKTRSRVSSSRGQQICICSIPKHLQRDSYQKGVLSHWMLESQVGVLYELCMQLEQGQRMYNSLTYNRSVPSCLAELLGKVKEAPFKGCKDLCTLQFTRSLISLYVLIWCVQMPHRLNPRERDDLQVVWYEVSFPLENQERGGRGGGRGTSLAVRLLLSGKSATDHSQ